MDGVRRYIASADDRHKDEIERADTELAGIVAQALETGQASEAYVYTTDILAGEGIEAIFTSQGYGDEVTFVNAFQLIDDLLNSRRSYSGLRLRFSIAVQHLVDPMTLEIQFDDLRRSNRIFGSL